MEKESKHPVNCPFNNCYYYSEEREIVGGIEYQTVYCSYPYEDFITDSVGRDCPHYKPDFTRMCRKKR